MLFRSMAGQAVPGWKVVEKVGRRRWVDNDSEIATYLEMTYGLEADDIRPRKLRTITDIEKQLKAALGKDGFAEAKEQLTMLYTVKESSGLTIALESDRRAAVVPGEAEFGSVNLNSLFTDGE